MTGLMRLPSCQQPQAQAASHSNALTGLLRAPRSQARCICKLAKVSRRSGYLSSRAVAEAPAEAPAASTTEKTGNSFDALLDIEAIQKILPHRFPFLLLDRVIELEHGKYAVGYKNVTANDNFFTGHFPDRKIMPGVLQVEAMAQLGGIVMMDPEKDLGEQQNFFFGGIDGCKFRRPVVPGDTLMMRVEMIKWNKRYGMAKMAAKAYIGKDVCCEAELTLILAK